MVPSCIVLLCISLPMNMTKHTTTSPYFAQANGEAEAAVRIAKGIIKQPDQFAALLNYRATPTAATGVSPAELLMGRRIRTTLPMLSNNLEPAWPDLEKVWECDNKAKESYSYRYNRRHGTRPLSELHPGDNVMTIASEHTSILSHTNGDTEATSSESRTSSRCPQTFDTWTRSVKWIRYDRITHSYPGSNTPSWENNDYNCITRSVRGNDRLSGIVVLRPPFGARRIYRFVTKTMTS